MKIEHVQVERIKVPSKRLRTKIYKRKSVEQLCNSIEEVGLLHPITINHEYKLIAGLKRLYAFRELRLSHYKYNEIPCVIIKTDDLPKIEAMENGTQTFEYKYRKQELLELAGL